MQKWKSAPLFITCLLCTGILLTSSACDQGPCQPQAPFLQVQVADGMIYISSTNSNQNAVSILRGSDGKQLQHVDNTDRQLANNGVVYIGEDASIVALQANDGKQLWQFAGSDTSSEPIAVQDGILYALGNSTLYAIRANDGTALWQFQPKNSSGGSFDQLAVANGRVYIGNDKTIYALQSGDGTLSWQFQSAIREEAFEVDNGVIYAVVNFSAVYALQANDGKQLWIYQQPPSASSLSVGKSLTIVNGVIYVQASTAILAIQASNGKLLWHFAGTTYVEFFGVANGVVYSQSLERISALRAKDGKQLWTSFNSGSSFVLDKENGTLYSNGSGGHVVALRLNNGSLLWQAPVDDTPRGVDNGVLYLADGKGGCSVNTPLYAEVVAIQAISGKVLWRNRIS